jgi:sugar/nucleoside kinase (ribokinase family)
MLKDENGKSALIGAVGDDKYGRLYSDLLKKENIVPIFETFKEVNTGICAVYCNNRDRGHITDLGASVMISDKMFEEAKEVLKKAELIFTELYIIKHKKDFVFKLAELGSKTGKIFGFNLPSFYFIETYLSDIKNLLKYADIVFTNSAEANYFANLCDFQQVKFPVN